MSAYGVYVHVPWCRIRCPYCAFDIVPREPAEPDPWVDGVLADLERWQPVFPGSPTTLYFGGGTPSRLSPAALARIIHAVGAPDITAEANPEDLPTWLDGALQAGITRVSLGVQTLQPHLARTLGRAVPDASRAIEAVARAPLASWSLDLMFGLPGQTRDDLERDLDALLAFHPPHVSLYGLTIEPGTGFGRLHERRPIPVPGERDWAWMYDRIVTRLREAGLERYEVSNFARPGHESAHNQHYWQGRPYLGLGPAAHGFAPDGRRWENAPWAGWRAGIPPAVETPSPTQAATDHLVSALRGRDGVPIAALAPLAPDPRTVRQLVAAGLLEDRPGRLVLADSGYPVADAVIRALVRGLG